LAFDKTHLSVCVLGSREDELENALSFWDNLVCWISDKQDFTLEILMVGPEIPEKYIQKEIQISSHLSIKCYKVHFFH